MGLIMNFLLESLGFSKLSNAKSMGISSFLWLILSFSDNLVFSRELYYFYLRFFLSDAK